MMKRVTADQMLERIAKTLEVPVCAFHEEPKPAEERDLDELRRIYSNLIEPDERARLLKVTRSLFGRRQR